MDRPQSRGRRIRHRDEVVITMDDEARRENARRRDAFRADTEARRLRDELDPPPALRQRPEPVRRPHMRETRRDGPGDGLVYRTHENAPTPAPAAAAAPSIADMEDAIADATVNLVHRAMCEERAERDRTVAELRREISELRGEVRALLTLLGKGADVVTLPKKFSA